MNTPAGLSARDFARLRALVYDQTGIRLDEDKKTMMEIRIKRRRRSLDIASFGDYCDHVSSPEGMIHELVHLTTVLAEASLGIYKSDALNPVPKDLQRKYFMRSRDPESNVMRVVRRLKFMDAGFGLIIYFDRATQIRLPEKLSCPLAPGGYFFLGHSESFQGMDLSLVPVAPAIYGRPR
jgi:chemotaxis methyl-accepting protein methylase